MINIKDSNFRETLEELKTDKDLGLTKEEASKRLEIFGYNKIAKKRRFVFLQLFLRQFYDFLTILMIVATIIALLVNKIPTAIAIGIIVVINVILGFVMEYKSEKSLMALKKMLISKCRVIRDKKEELIETSLIVPGDIFIIEEGQKIPADAQIIDEMNLRVNEAALTGESVPVQKYINDIIFMGTIAVAGQGGAVVVATGKKTEFGKIAESLAVIKEPLTPLQKQVIRLSKLISFIGFIFALLILILGQFQGMHFLKIEQLILALSIFISVAPTGLLVVMTLTLAVGVQRMVKEKAVIKKLSSVETLGSTQVICTDKTGTLTENKMTAKTLWLGGKFFDVETGSSLRQFQDIDRLIKIGVICNSAEVIKNNQGDWDFLGDPTEASLLVLGEKVGYLEKELKSKGEVLEEFAFQQKLRRRASVFKDGEKVSFYSIGSPENILEVSSFYLRDGQEIELSEGYREEIKRTFLSLASQGYRVIGLADKKILEDKKYNRKELEKEMVFVGLVALYDPPRPEVKNAIRECKEAGIRVVMITGDNELTALAIAREIGLVEKDEGNGEKVIKGEEIEKMSDNELLEIISQHNLFARTMPVHKLRIVKAFQKQGQVVAVTGDGVNDSPALKKADIGVAMGIRGTDVSKEAADMIILDDNFASISKAVKQGRIIYNNIKKFIKFLLTANAIETPLIITAIFLGIPLPLLPLHILWINFVTDSAPALTLGIEPGAKDIMKRKPRPTKEHFLKGTIPFILLASFLGYIFALIIFIFFYNSLTGLLFAQTMTFTFIVLYKLFLTFSCRSSKETIFSLGLFSNKPMLLAVLFSFILQLIIIYVPFMQVTFQTTALTFFHWLIIFTLASIAFFLVEAKKVLFKKFDKIKEIV